jgi:hypothetical protein
VYANLGGFKVIAVCSFICSLDKIVSPSDLVGTIKLHILFDSFVRLHARLSEWITKGVPV